MKKLIVFSLTVVSFFTAINCSDEPIPPCTDCPQPLDTTSHDFVWTIDTLGDASSQLNDVTIINDTCVWAVGTMYLQDSIGNFIYPIYNAAYWNGKTWSLKRITVDHKGNQITPELYGSYAFSHTDIWFSSGVPIHGNGQVWTMYHLFDMGILSENDGSVNKFWGTSSLNFYLVGNKGTIVYHNGSTWQKISSGTTLPIQDIWGSVDAKTGEPQVLVVASNKFLNEGKKLLQINNNIATTLSDSGLSWSLSGIWFEANKQYYIVGDGVYPSKELPSRWKRDETFPPIYKNAIRANNWNDVVIAGAFGLLLHYNGSTWKNYKNAELPEINGAYYSVAIKNDLVVAVGYVGDRGIVVMGKRK